MAKLMSVHVQPKSTTKVQVAPQEILIVQVINT